MLTLLQDPNPLRQLAPVSLSHPQVTLAVALLAGMVAQVIARHLRIPGIVLLLLAGVLLGPDVAGIVQPGTLGNGLSLIVNAAVAVILFEGGLNLDIVRLRREALTIRRLVTLGAIVTAVGGTLAGRYIMAWPWEIAVLFGTLVIVTGPTVITPLLRRIRVNRSIHTILEAEAVFIDPIGAIIAVVALELVLAQEGGAAAAGLLSIPGRLLLGTAVGAIGGFAMAQTLTAEKLLPSGLETVFTLSLLLFIYFLSEQLAPESGIMAAPVAGLVVGNIPSRLNRQLREFKEQLTVMLIGLLFVLLAADVRVAEVTGLGWRGLATVVVLIALVRPAGVALSTRGSALTWQERVFMGWLAPRGIVAAAVASLFAQALEQAGMPHGGDLRALVFMVIAITVVVQGLSGGGVARVLRVRRPSETGYLIAGANVLACTLARLLKDQGEDVVLVDSDPAQVQAARREGLTALQGNALDEEMLEAADAEGKYGVVGLIANEGVSLLVVEKVQSEFHIPAAYVAVRPGRSALPPERLRAVGALPLFKSEVQLARWISELSIGQARVAWFRYTGREERPLSSWGSDDAVLPLALSRGNRTLPADAQMNVRNGDRVALALADGRTLDAMEPAT